MPNHAAALSTALRALAASRFPAQAVEQLVSRSSALADDLRAAVLAAVPAFSESRNPDILPELVQHSALHADELVRLLRGGDIGDFAFVRDHAERRAEQRFPLEAVLHAYRCGHKVFSRRLRDAALAEISSDEQARQAVAALADFAIEYTDAISMIAASAYTAHTRLLTEVAGDRRAQLLTLLLEGHDEADGRIAQILRDEGYLDSRQTFCVAVARSVEPTEMLNPARARRMVDSIADVFASSRMRLLIDLRDNKVTMVCSDARRDSGWTAPRSSLAQRLSATLALVGNAALIGVSNDAPSTAHIPNAHREALVALDLADVTRRVALISDIPAQRLLLHFGGEELQRLLPAWTNAFFAADEAARGALVATLRAYADAHMNVLKAAEKLGVHPNTIYSRLQRVSDLTGLEPRSFGSLSELLVVVDCRRRFAAALPGRARGGGRRLGANVESVD
jgi:hypothetical protein